MYEALASFAQTGGLVLFVVAFILVLIYVFNPANRQDFEEAEGIPLRDGDE